MPTTIRVLLIEDSEDDARLMLRELRRGGFEPEYERVDTPEEMKAALQSRQWDIVLSDYMMPRFTGPAALQLVLDSGLDIPFIVLSGQVGEHTAIDMLTAGAHGYVMKDNMARLIPAVQRELKYAALRREQRESTEALRAAHEELRLAHMELEKRVQERTAELAIANQELQAEIVAHKEDERERERLLGQVQDMNGRLINASLQAKVQAEEAERRAEEIDLILYSISDGLIIYGPEGEIVRMNSAAERILGVSMKQWQGMAPAERTAQLHVTTPEGQPIASEDTPRDRALRGETVSGYRMIVHHPDGTAVHVISTTAPIRDARGRVIGAVANFTDITALRELEEQREDFLRAVSHDLRNPLGVVIGQAQMIQRYPDKPSLVRTGAGAVITSARRMDVIIQDLVESIRLDAGEISLRKQPVNVRSLVLDLLERFKVTIDVDRIKVEMPDDLPVVSADVDRLERIATNLITNALKYSPPETEVLITAEAIDREVQVSVADQGIGIAPADLPHIFERFYQPTIRPEKRGLGLGLYITSKLVVAHSGRTWVESELDKGSTFYFTLPVEEDASNGSQQ